MMLYAIPAGRPAHPRSFLFLVFFFSYFYNPVYSVFAERGIILFLIFFMPCEALYAFILLSHHYHSITILIIITCITFTTLCLLLYVDWQFVDAFAGD